jgi:type IV pilus assembly protein PilE
MHTCRRQPRPARSAVRRARGFTLIEVVIVVSIIAILSMVAYPSYRDYLRRGQLADATNGLSVMRAQMERHFQDNRSYATVGAFTTPCSAAASTRTFGLFVVSCAGTPTAAAFTLQAVGSGQVSGFTFTINQADARATTAAPGSGWNTCATTWMVKKGQPCT